MASQAETTREILEYFLRNPQARDTLEGITRWRLLEQTVHQNVQDTLAALRWLVSRGLLVEFLTASGVVFYLDAERTEEARRLLRDGLEPDSEDEFDPWRRDPQ